MTENIEKLENEVDSFYNKFKTDNELQKYLNEKNHIAGIDEKRDEIYRTDEKYYEVAKKGKYINNHGDVFYGLRVRLQDKEGIERIKSILSVAKYNPDDVITEVKERMCYIEVTIEFFDPEKLI